MANDLVSPEIILLDTLSKEDNALSPALWDQMRNEIAVFEENDRALAPAVRFKKKMLLSDFVNKAISLPLEISPSLSPLAEKQLYRLHLFCCQRIIHNPEVRRNPLILGFRALEEMKLALTGIMISYRLVTPSCPYSWNRAFFEGKILTHKAPDGHTIINFKAPLQEDIINAAVTEDLVTDWLIYRAYDNNGIRTLMDIKNNLLTLPDYLRGGHPADEFSRFERKMAEQRNKKELKRNEELDLEFRKTLVKNVAELTTQNLIAQGLSPAEILQKAMSEDFAKLAIAPSSPQPLTASSPTEQNLPKKTRRAILPPKQKTDTREVDKLISELLEEG